MPWAFNLTPPNESWQQNQEIPRTPLRAWGHALPLSAQPVSHYFTRTCSPRCPDHGGVSHFRILEHSLRVANVFCCCFCCYCWFYWPNKSFFLLCDQIQSEAVQSTGLGVVSILEHEILVMCDASSLLRVALTSPQAQQDRPEGSEPERSNDTRVLLALQTYSTRHFQRASGTLAVYEISQLIFYCCWRTFEQLSDPQPRKKVMNNLKLPHWCPHFVSMLLTVRVGEVYWGCCVA